MPLIINQKKFSEQLTEALFEAICQELQNLPKSTIIPHDENFDAQEIRYFIQGLFR